MGNTGQGTAVHIGIGKTWAAKAPAQVAFSHLSESLKRVVEYSEEESLVGGATTSRMDIQGEKVEGDLPFYAKPDNIGFALALALGAEAAPVAVAGAAAAYDHVFTLLPGGAGNSLPSASIIVDRHVAVKEYVSCKVDSFSLEAAVKDYLQGSLTFRGHSESDGVLGAFDPSPLPALRFKEGTVKIDDVVLADVTSFKLAIANALESDLYTMSSGGNMAEIDAQKRAVTLEIEALYNAANEAIREAKFVAGQSLDLDVEFVSSAEVEAGFPFRLSIAVPLGYLTDASPNIGGSDRMKQTLYITATEQAGTEAITMTVRDARATAYIPA